MTNRLPPPARPRSIARRTPWWIAGLLVLCAQSARGQSFEIELGAFWALSSTDLTVYDPIFEQDRLLNFESELNLPHNQTLAYLDLEYRFQPRHMIYLDWRRLHRTGENHGVMDPFQFTWDNQRYQVDTGSYLATELNVDIVRFGYGYRFYQSEKIAADLLTGLHFTHLKLGFRGDLEMTAAPTHVPGSYSELHLEVANSVTAPLPSLGLQMEYQLGKKWQIRSHLQAFYLSMGEISGWMGEAEIAARYHITDALSVTAAYSYFQVGVDYQPEYSDLNVTHRFYGPMAKLAYRF
ncbi:DUF481 domain-containing protein [Ferrimonas balearica]|uniref:DUF481 domain-containing protein n=1 Tax=Ferrimonas balearica TaxID=44012 RepID=UPI001C99107D|nr:DUF481 domain-containing protein [Ferrimonas balearica]MBY5993146.1 DUF481 domain-containing protein [Ferrimonas balearica]